MAINVAIMGFGTVGSGVAETLDVNKDLITKRVGEEINVKYILDIRDFSDHPESGLFVNNVDTIADDPEVAIVVDPLSISMPI